MPPRPGIAEFARLLTAVAQSGHLDTIVDLLPAAQWDEREAHDLYGVHFDGHDPLRALVAHPDDERYRALFGQTVRTPLFDVEVPVLAHPAAVLAGGVRVDPQS